MAQNVRSLTAYDPLDKQITVCFLLLEGVHLIDLAGPAQVFYEASQFGKTKYRLIFCSVGSQANSKQGLTFANLTACDTVELQKGDFIFVPGTDFKSFQSGALREDIRTIRPWLIRSMQNGIRLASVCSGSLVLAEAGVLNGRKCTTHWKCFDFMKAHYPLIQVQADRLFVKDDTIFTSAGMTSGIDMALSILEEAHGPILAAKVARELVVYLRRNDTDHQQTIYLDYRTHFNPAVHKIQDYIISHPGENPGLEELSGMCSLSKRNLTRQFRKATGHSIVEFKNLVKIELARTLAYNEDYTTDKIASLCGFQSARHLRRVWNKKKGEGTFKHFRSKDASGA